MRSTSTFLGLLVVLLLFAGGCADPEGGLWKERRSNREEVKTLVSRAEDAIESRDGVNAALDLEKAISLGERTATLYDLLGQANMVSEIRKKAIEAYGTAIAIDNTRPEIFFHLAKAFLESKEPTHAQTAAEQGLLLKNDFPGGNLLLSDILEARWDLEAALEAAKKELSHHKEDEKAQSRVKLLTKKLASDKPHWEKARILEKDGKIAEAVVSVKKAIARKKRTVYRKKLLDLLVRAERFGDAKTTLDTLAVEGYLDEPIKGYVKTLVAKGMVPRYRFLVELGAEDDLVRRMGLTRTDMAGMDQLKIRTRSTDKVLRYKLHMNYIFQKAGQAVMINLDNYLVFKMTVKKRPKLLEKRITVMGSYSEISPVSTNADYGVRWRSDAHKDEVYAQYLGTKKSLGLMRKADIVLYETDTGEVRNVLINGHPTDPGVRVADIPFAFCVFPKASVRLGTTWKAGGSLIGNFFGFFQNQHGNKGVCLRYDASGGTGPKVKASLFKRIFADPKTGIIYLDRARTELTLVKIEAEVTTDLQLVNKETFTDLVQEYNGKPELGVID